MRIQRFQSLVLDVGVINGAINAGHYFSAVSKVTKHGDTTGIM